MSGAQYFSQHFWDNLEAKGDRKDIQKGMLFIYWGEQSENSIRIQLKS